KFKRLRWFHILYTGSMPAAVKNALDVGSRDPKGNPWAGKRAAVFSSSPGGFGGMAANHALRQVFVFLDIIPIQQPEVYLSKVDTLFEGESLKEGTREFLRCAVMTLVNSIKK
ncbi:MAG: NAD(P)H-dependent oxidoreductase, partial [Eubacteriales bacterium]|nr:NAD(P)H-dependent oxidoreductase [Eubacteriales bacterium]